ncbi:MAG: cohesin domain-containing protein [Bacteroidetes bacterium]|nr:cohesin domain-containing protein [Bacteroidota bacterium]
MKVRIFTMALVLPMVLWMTQMATGQVITTAPTLTACPGTTISVPVTVQNFNSIASVSLSLGYDPTVMTYTSYTINPALAGGFTVVNSPTPFNKVLLAWFALTPVTLPAGAVLVTFNYNYTGGNSNLNWDLSSTACQYSDLMGDPVSADWVNGSVSSSTPSIVTQPVSVNASAGSTADFTVTANNASTYQWQESTNGSTWNNLNNGGNYSGVNTNHLTISNVTTAMNGYQYRCIVGETVCNQSVTSNPAMLMVSSPSTTTTLPNLTACPGTPVSLPVIVDNFTGIASISMTVNLNPLVLTYTGYTLNPSLTGGTAVVNCPPPYNQLILAWFSLSPATLASGSVLVTFNFSYSGGTMPLTFDLANNGACLYSNITGEILPSVWNNGSVSPSAPLPTVTSQPADVSANSGTSANFIITSTNATTYQWQENTNGSTWNNINNSSNYSGTTSNHLIISNISIIMNGYQYRCQLGETVCNQSVFSNPASLTVTSSDVIVTLPSINSCPGTINVPITADNFTNVASLSITIIIDPVVLTLTGYDLNPSFAGGYFGINSPSPYTQVLASWFSLTPVSLANGSTMLTLIFSYSGGTSPLSFNLIPEGTCMITDMSASPMPTEWVNGSISPTAAAPTVSMQPVNANAENGATASFTCIAVNASAYQWQESANGTSWSNITNAGDYSGATTDLLVISNVSAGINGYLYRCRITEDVCNQAVLTDPATLTVVSSGIIITIPNISSCPGTAVSFPLTVQNFTDVASFSITTNFNPAVLTYTGYSLNPALSGGFTVVNCPGPDFNQVKAAWFSLSAVNLPPGATLITFNFNYSGGSSFVSFDLVTEGNCAFSNILGDLLPAGWINGFMGPTVPLININVMPTGISALAGHAVFFDCLATYATAFQWQERILLT